MNNAPTALDSPHAAQPPSFSGLTLYALVNPYLGDYPDPNLDLSARTISATLAQARSEAWSGRFVQVAESREPATDPQRLSYLVRLDGPGDPLLATLIKDAGDEHQQVLEGRHFARYSVGTLLETSLEPALLMQRLEHMWAYRAFSGKTWYLCMADRRVFEALAEWLPAEALANWLGPIARWHVLTREGTWLTRRGAFDETALGEEQIYTRHQWLAEHALTHAKLKVSLDQHQRIESLQTISCTLTLRQRENHCLGPCAHERAWQGTRVAASHGLHAIADQAAFACCWMQDAQCAESPRVHEALRRHRAGEQAFADALAELSADLPDDDVGTQPAPIRVSPPNPFA